MKVYEDRERKKVRSAGMAYRAGKCMANISKDKRTVLEYFKVEDVECG